VIEIEKGKPGPTAPCGTSYKSDWTRIHHGHKCFPVFR
jgi:hypothetical protein